MPEGWTKTKLGAVLTLEYGKSLPESQRRDGGYPVYGSNGIVGNHDEFLVPGPGIVVGRKGSFGEVTWTDKEFFPIDTTYYVKPGDSIDLRLAYYLLRSVHLKSLNRSTAIPGLNRNDAYDIDISLPPLRDQQRIVAKLDTLFGHLDQLKGRLEKIPTLLKQFRQAVLTQAVTGKLTEEWRKEHNFADWKVSALNDVIIGKPKNGYSAKPVSYETKFKVLTLTATTSGRFIPGHYKYFDGPIAADSIFWLKPNDLLIQRGNTREYVGVSAIYDGPIQTYIYPDLMMKVEANETVITTKYLCYCLSSEASRNYLRDRATGTAGNMPKINQQILLTVPIFLPQLQEQKEIVRRVDTLFVLADAIEKRCVTLREHLNDFPKSLLSKAFNVGHT